MRRLALSLAVCASVFAAPHAGRSEPPQPASVELGADAQPIALGVSEPARPEGSDATPGEWAAKLPTLRVQSVHSGLSGDVRLYADDGSVNADAARAFDELVT